MDIGRAEQLQLPLPPLPEQRRIAAVLDAADALRAKRRAALGKLDALLQSVFLEMFGDPVRNEKGWVVKPLSDTCQLQLGKMLDSKRQTGIHRRPYLRNANVQWNRFDLESVLEMDFDDGDREKFSLKGGDLLVCEGGEVGRTAIWRGQLHDCYYQKALHRVRPYQNIVCSEYVLVYMWLMAKFGGFADFTSTATIAHLTAEKLSRLPLPLPPLNRQRDFSERYNSIELLRKRQIQGTQYIDKLFTSLQYRAFRGEL
jgi:type I restriction enzyme S subunit